MKKLIKPLRISFASSSTFAQLPSETYARGYCGIKSSDVCIVNTEKCFGQYGNLIGFSDNDNVTIAQSLRNAITFSESSDTNAKRLSTFEMHLTHKKDLTLTIDNDKFVISSLDDQICSGTVRYSKSNCRRSYIIENADI